jgi:hypothetical protein
MLQEFRAHLVEDSAAVLPVGSTPIGTYENIRTYHGVQEETLHPVCSLGEHLDNKHSVLLAPSAYLLVRMNNRTDIIHDILLLSSLVMKRHAKRCQRLENSLYVDLGSTCDTYVQFWKAQADEIVDKIEYLFSCGWKAGIVRTLVESIQNEINGALNRN